MFHEVVYPLSLERCLSTWEWATNILELGDASEQRIPIGADGRRKFDASHGVRSLKDLQTLLKFHALRHGETYGFKVKDLVDCTVSVGTEGTLQHVYDGVIKTFQLQKIYADDAASHFREIYKPQAGTVKVYKNAALQVEGTHYTVDYTTGLVTFTSAPAPGSVIEWSGHFYVPVRFAVREIPAPEFFASMVLLNDEYVVRDGSADLPEVGMIEIKDFK